VATRTLSEAELGDSLTLSVGDELVVELNERPSTGYRWAIAYIDPAVLAVREGTHQATSEALGAARARRLVFVALAVGQTQLRLERSRGDATDRQLALGVVVEA